MMEEKEKKFLTVAPFQCAWRKDLKFREAGRGCVAFDAFAHNDVTLVFRENVGSQHYHYKRDDSPHYTVILGSHRNRRLKIEVDGKTEVDVEGIGLCCSSAFQSYWICIYDGLISIGKGRYPFQNLVFQWLDSNPNCSVRYVGLSSWDKHVGYRNVNVLSLPQNHMLLWKQVDSGEYEGKEDSEEELEDEQIEYDKWGLDNFLESWELSDMFFVVGEEERPVPAHKVILQASGNFPLSPSNENVLQLKDLTYPTLHALLQFIYTGHTQMFTNGMRESSSSEVSLSDVSPEAFKIMLDFMYSGEISLEDTMDFGNLLLQLLLLADKFGVTLLYQECCKTLLECLSEDSECPILLAVSSLPSCKLIEETCVRKCAMHFDYCTTASLDFILLDDTTFSSIIQHQELTVTSEERVLNAILMWCMRAKELCGWEMVDELLANSTADLIFQERLPSLSDLLPFVRFPLLPYHLLQKLGQSNLSKHVHIFYNIQVREAINYVEFGLGRAGSDQNIRFQHRRSSYKELQYIYDGDSNGVLYFAGTSYGEHQWVNPVLAKRITITASSPTSRYTDPKALVSRTYQGTCIAGPRMEDGNKCVWWMIDLGQDHQLVCNYYTLRQDGSRAYIRSWNFQGSLDGKTWTNLRVHEYDQTICKPGQFASWAITGPNSLLPFRFFRVVLTGPTVDASDPWNLCICYLELYGFFR
ncbi:BTB/POZ domain-containing protein At2g30600 isoform X5 [Hevea brasiliensis]|uniref:BTB/POZ domain-containing protein At2g30600 isoform X5 n=1 Tax=Hevea brasiliensis TaxID=3981 RepID=UPI0025D9A6CA|nr:BTB/POZ domain-containing protein At2g30600 isoform X5 [Hevea brasiliensis]